MSLFAVFVDWLSTDEIPYLFWSLFTSGLLPVTNCPIKLFLYLPLFVLALVSAIVWYTNHITERVIVNINVVFLILGLVTISFKNSKIASTTIPPFLRFTFKLPHYLNNVKCRCWKIKRTLFSFLFVNVLFIFILILLFEYYM